MGPHPEPGAGVAPDGLHRPRQGTELDRVGPVEAYGESLTSNATATMSSTPTEEASAKAWVHPSSCSAHASGAAAMIAPSWPTWPVSWVTKGACRTRNQTDTSRITLTKTIASPAP